MPNAYFFGGMVAVIQDRSRLGTEEAIGERVSEDRFFK